MEPHQPGDTSNLHLYIQFTGTWFLMFVNLVPISLLVCLETVKFIQGFLLGWDLQMYDYENDVSMIAQSSNLNEELGMVEYVFSDKTGTLTQNLMEFKCFTVGMKAYGKYHPTKVVGDRDARISDVEFEKSLLQKDEAVTDYLRFLALCHDVSIDNSKGRSEYTSASPDEIAFVEFARKCGVHYCNKDAEDLVTLNNTVGGQPLVEEFHKIEGTCAFTSNRKMSSNIYLQDGRYFVYTKGADIAVEKCLGNTDPNLLKFTKDMNDEYSEKGLRNLYLAKGEITVE